MRKMVWMSIEVLALKGPRWAVKGALTRSIYHSIALTRRLWCSSSLYDQKCIGKLEIRLARLCRLCVSRERLHVQIVIDGNS